MVASAATRSRSSSLTDATGRAFPFGSLTLPFTTIVCEYSAMGNNVNSAMRGIRSLFDFVLQPVNIKSGSVAIETWFPRASVVLREPYFFPENRAAFEGYTFLRFQRQEC